MSKNNKNKNKKTNKRKRNKTNTNRQNKTKSKNKTNKQKTRENVLNAKCPSLFSYIVPERFDFVEFDVLNGVLTVSGFEFIKHKRKAFFF